MEVYGVIREFEYSVPPKLSELGSLLNLNLALVDHFSKDLPGEPWIEIDGDVTGSNYINSKAISINPQFTIDLAMPANHKLVLHDASNNKLLKSFNLEISEPRQGPFPLNAMQAYPSDNSYPSDFLNRVVVADLEGDGSGDVVACGSKVHIFRGHLDDTLDPDEIVEMGIWNCKPDYGAWKRGTCISRKPYQDYPGRICMADENQPSEIFAFGEQDTVLRMG